MAKSIDLVSLGVLAAEFQRSPAALTAILARERCQPALMLNGVRYFAAASVRKLASELRKQDLANAVAVASGVKQRGRKKGR
jgi:hypothetical protein